MDNNIHSGHRKKMYRKFMERGFGNDTPPHEILEILLFFSIPRRDTNELAHRLISHFGSLSAVFDADPKDIANIEGIGENSATLIKLIPEIGKYYVREKQSKVTQLNNIEEAGTYLLNRYAFYGNEEVFSVISMSSAGKLISFDEVEFGDISSVGVSTRKIIEILIRTKASCVILAHNHPSGIALPSDSDLKVTKTVRAALEHIGVTLVDHIIIADGDFVSLAQTPRFSDIF